MLTVLHISDLHRTKGNPVSNTSLMSSILRDVDNYNLIGASKPDLIVVSGDIIQGSADVDNTSTPIKEQYSEALDFLIKLTDQLLSGNRSNVVIVPGNHDICWEQSFNSMLKIDESKVKCSKGLVKKEFLQQAMKTNSFIRWSWPERSFYRIEDKELYNSRLKHFCDFYNTFYKGQRNYSLEPNEQFDIFDYPQFGVTIVGFNSCFQNDHLNKAGAINSECIASASLCLRQYVKDGRLLMATWHHNTKGTPYEQDYMDGSFIKNLIADAVKIGFHGHQHKLEILREENNIIDNKGVVIFSAGSLCAGPREIPTGHNQQYNIVEISRASDREINVKALSRVKSPNSSFENPIWETGTINDISPLFEMKMDHSEMKKQSLGDVEAFIGNKAYKKAFELLIEYDLSDTWVRVFLLECCNQLDDYRSIIKYFIEPQNNAEAVALLDACLDYNDQETTKNILALTYIAESGDPSLNHLKEQLKRKLK